MHILLININPVVSRLINLCVREDNIDLEEVDNIGAVSRDKYDVIFVDEASFVDEMKKVLENLMVRKKVFLSSRDEVGDEGKLFDSIIKKPFLPSQITEVFESIEKEETAEQITEFPSIFPLSNDMQDNDDLEESEDEAAEEDTKVLDPNEIDRIKALLDMEEEETANDREEDTEQVLTEDEPVELSDQKEKKKKSDHSEKNKEERKLKKSRKKREKSATFEEALLSAVEGMKVKKIKKLLKGAEVTIKIRFKDGK